MAMQKRTGNIINPFILLIMSVLIVVLPFVADKSLMFPTQSAKFFLFAYSILLILFLFFFQKLLEVRQTKGGIPVITSEIHALFKISFIDMALFVWFIYISVRVFSSYELYGLSTQYLELWGLAITYYIIRSFNGNYFTILIGVMMTAGIAQALYGHLQLYSVFPSHHNMFKITGGFFNPGHYAGYLALIFPIALAIQLFKPSSEESLKMKFRSNLSETKILHFLSLASIITILLIIPSTRSRAAWLGLMTSTIYLLYVKYDFAKWFTLHINTKMRKVSVVLVCAILIGVVAIGLYIMKKESADGRMLIWKVSAEMIKDKPIFGHGYDRFKAHYLNYQARYFQEQEKTSEAINADDTRRAFNEFIELTSEDGIVGLLLITTMMYLIFFSNEVARRQKKCRHLVVTCRAGILAFAVFACFSYPSEILPMKLILIVCLAGISTQQKKVIALTNCFGLFNRSLGFQFIQKGIVLVGLMIVAWSFVPLTKAFNSHQIWKKAFVLYQMRAYKQSLEEYQQIYPLLRYNGDYLISYGKACSMAGQHRLSIKILERGESFFPSSTLSTALGDSYKATGNYRLAEQAYQKAVNMVPDRFYPKYLLAKLYDESGQAFKAIVIANELLQKEPKVRSVAVDEIKKEMQEIVNKSKRSSS